MSLFDYQASKQVAADDPPFAALVMAAYRKADTGNAAKLEMAFPDITRELRARYDAPGGILPGEQVSA